MLETSSSCSVTISKARQAELENALTVRDSTLRISIIVALHSGA